jgi:tetratricopeptide (TPR) repeat protein
LTHVIYGDLDSANAELAKAVCRSEGLGYPEDATNRAHTYFHQIWVCLEAGNLDEATGLVAQMRRFTEEAGLDMWRLVAVTQRATVKAMCALRDNADASTLLVRAEKIAHLVDASRMLSLRIYLTFHDAVIGRLLMAAGQPEKARARFDFALRHAEETGMQFEDAELMRLRAHTFSERPQRRAALDNALALSRRQGAALFELRCLLDYFDLDVDGDRAGLAAVVDRFPDGACWPELALAERILS